MICLGSFVLLDVSHPPRRALGRLCWFVGTACWVCIQLEEKRGRDSGVKDSKGQTSPYGKTSWGLLESCEVLKPKTEQGWSRIESNYGPG